MTRLLFALLLPFAASAQSLLEYGAAASTGAAAAVAAKPLSDSLDRIFKSTSAATELAAEPATAKPKPAVKDKPTAKPAAKEKEITPGQPNRSVRTRDVLLANTPVPAMSYFTGAPAPAPRPSARSAATSAQVAAVATGSSARQLLDTLGTPTARIQIPEDGRLLEIWRYSNGDTDAGSVRLVNGIVSEVRSAR